MIKLNNLRIKLRDWKNKVKWNVRTIIISKKKVERKH